MPVQAGLAKAYAPLCPGPAPGVCALCLQGLGHARPAGPPCPCPALSWQATRVAEQALCTVLSPLRLLLTGTSALVRNRSLAPTAHLH